MNLLFLASHLPSPRARQAGQKTTYFACQWFARRHQVHLLSFATEHELETYRREDMFFFETCEIVPVTMRSRLLGVLANPRLPLVAAARRSPRFLRKLRELLRRTAFDMAYLDFTGMMRYAEELRRVPEMAVMEVDVTFRWWERRQEHAGNALLGTLYGAEARRTKRWELEHLRRMDLALVQSWTERKLLEELLPGLPVEELRPWVELGSGRQQVPYGEREPHSLVFWGAMNRVENVDAATFAADRVLPLVREREPQARLHVVGSHPPEELARRYRGTATTVHGFVDDPHGFLSGKRIGLLPMRLGAGIKVKVLECMAAGLPVVTTPAGAESIPGREGAHYLLGRTERELADGVLALLREPERAEEMGRRARQLLLSGHFFEEPLLALERRIRERAGRGETIRRHAGVEVNR